jgi:hypothetical protein
MACMQGQPLSSLDGRCFLLVQPDGNLVLYSTLVYGMYGPVDAAAIWSANSYGVNSGPPYTLTMQSVRAPPCCHAVPGCAC